MIHRQKIRVVRRISDLHVRPKGHHRGTSTESQTAEKESQAASERNLLRQNQQIQAALESIQEAAIDYEQRRQQSLIELQKIAVELAILAAAHVVHSELERDSLGVESFVASAIARLGILEPATIRLHPADLELLNTQLGTRSAPWNEMLMTLIADAAVSRGGVRLDTNSGRVVFSDVATRLTEIRHEWMENINDAQAESRRVPNDSQSLRRFPDRRETA